MKMNLGKLVLLGTGLACASLVPANLYSQKITSLEFSKQPECEVVPSKRTYSQMAEYCGKVYKVNIKEDEGRFGVLGISPSAPDSLEKKIFAIAVAERRADLAVQYAYKECLDKVSDIVIEMACQLASEGSKDFFRDHYGSSVDNVYAQTRSFANKVVFAKTLINTMDFVLSPSKTLEKGLDVAFKGGQQIDNYRTNKATEKESSENSANVYVNVEQDLANKVVEVLKKGSALPFDERKYCTLIESPKISSSPLFQMAVFAYDLRELIKNSPALSGKFVYDYSKPATAEDEKKRLDRYSRVIATFLSEIDCHKASEHAFSNIRLFSNNYTKGIYKVETEQGMVQTKIDYYRRTFPYTLVESVSFEDVMRGCKTNVDLRDNSRMVAPESEEKYRNSIDNIFTWFCKTDITTHLSSVLKCPKDEDVERARDAYFKDIANSIE